MAALAADLTSAPQAASETDTRSLTCPVCGCSGEVWIASETPLPSIRLALQSLVKAVEKLRKDVYIGPGTKRKQELETALDAAQLALDAAPASAPASQGVLDAAGAVCKLSPPCENPDPVQLWEAITKLRIALDAEQPAAASPGVRAALDNICDAAIEAHPDQLPVWLSKCIEAGRQALESESVQTDLIDSIRKQAMRIHALLAVNAELVAALEKIYHALQTDTKQPTVCGDTMCYHLDGGTMALAINETRAALAKAGKEAA